MGHTCNPKVQETEAELLQVWGQPVTQIKFLVSQRYIVSLKSKITHTYSLEARAFQNTANKPVLNCVLKAEGTTLIRQKKKAQKLQIYSLCHQQPLSNIYNTNFEINMIFLISLSDWQRSRPNPHEAHHNSEGQSPEPLCCCTQAPVPSVICKSCTHSSSSLMSFAAPPPFTVW